MDFATGASLTGVIFRVTDAEALLSPSLAVKLKESLPLKSSFSGV